VGDVWTSLDGGSSGAELSPAARKRVRESAIRFSIAGPATPLARFRRPCEINSQSL